MEPPKHLEALYAYAVDWCSVRGVPLDWIRVWGRDMTQPHAECRFDGQSWRWWITAGYGVATVQVDVFSEELAMAQALALGDRSRVWLMLPSPDDLSERGLSSYAADVRCGCALVLAVAGVELTHEWKLLRPWAANSPVDTMYCKGCNQWTRYQSHKIDLPSGPCCYWVEPLLDLPAFGMAVTEHPMKQSFAITKNGGGT